jgi:hypothetical protein
VRALFDRRLPLASPRVTDDSTGGLPQRARQRARSGATRGASARVSLPAGGKSQTSRTLPRDWKVARAHREHFVVGGRLPGDWRHHIRPVPAVVIHELPRIPSEYEVSTTTVTPWFTIRLPSTYWKCWTCFSGFRADIAAPGGDRARSHSLIGLLLFPLDPRDIA